MGDTDRVTGLLAAIVLVAMVFVTVRFVIPALVNMHTDGGLIGAFLAALCVIGLAATAILKVVALLGDHTKGHSDEEK